MVTHLVSHREKIRSVVLQVKVFILEHSSVNTLPSLGKSFSSCFSCCSCCSSPPPASPSPSHSPPTSGHLAVALREVSRLDHEVLHNAVEGGALEEGEVDLKIGHEIGESKEEQIEYILHVFGTW